MKKFILVVIFGLMWMPHSEAVETRTVLRVVDGGTLELTNGEQIGLILDELRHRREA